MSLVTFVTAGYEGYAVTGLRARRAREAKRNEIEAGTLGEARRRKQRETIATLPAAERVMRRRLPYGSWTRADGREVLFNRHYQPIWQR
jgi:hypothetical protein